MSGSNGPMNRMIAAHSKPLLDRKIDADRARRTQANTSGRVRNPHADAHSIGPSLYSEETPNITNTRRARDQMRERLSHRAVVSRDNKSADVRNWSNQIDEEREPGESRLEIESNGVVRNQNGEEGDPPESGWTGQADAGTGVSRSSSMISIKGLRSRSVGRNEQKMRLSLTRSRSPGKQKEKHGVYLRRDEFESSVKDKSRPKSAPRTKYKVIKDADGFVFVTEKKETKLKRSKSLPRKKGSLKKNDVIVSATPGKESSNAPHVPSAEKGEETYISYGTTESEPVFRPGASVRQGRSSGVGWSRAGKGGETHISYGTVESEPTMRPSQHSHQRRTRGGKKGDGTLVSYVTANSEPVVASGRQRSNKKDGDGTFISCKTAKSDPVTTDPRRRSKPRSRSRRNQRPSEESDTHANAALRNVSPSLRCRMRALMAARSMSPDQRRSSQIDQGGNHISYGKSAPKITRVKHQVGLTPRREPKRPGRNTADSESGTHAVLTGPDLQWALCMQPECPESPLARDFVHPNQENSFPVPGHEPTPQPIPVAVPVSHPLADTVSMPRALEGDNQVGNKMFEKEASFAETFSPYELDIVENDDEVGCHKHACSGNSYLPQNAKIVGRSMCGGPARAMMLFGEQIDTTCQYNELSSERSRHIVPQEMNSMADLVQDDTLRQNDVNRASEDKMKKRKERIKKRIQQMQRAQLREI